VRTIWKYNLGLGLQTLTMPTWSEIVHVENQQNCACMWAVVDTETPVEKRHFLMLMTGQEIPDTVSTFSYLGTVMIDGFVGHIFEVHEKSDNDLCEECEKEPCMRGNETAERVSWHGAGHPRPA